MSASFWNRWSGPTWRNGFVRARIDGEMRDLGEENNGRQDGSSLPLLRQSSATSISPPFEKRRSGGI